MRTSTRTRGVLAAALAGACVAIAPAAAQADSYSYTTCDGVGYVFQTGANGSTTVMWYDLNGNWGYLAPNIHPCYQ